MARLTFLGTGTSDGIPRIGCNCKVCKSLNPKDSRLRTSALVEFDNKRILIDAGIDFRQQALKANINSIDAILLTHAHTDHIEGITELRPLSQKNNKSIECYADSTTINEIKTRFDYIFNYSQLGGGLPKIGLNIINSDFQILGKKISTIPVRHGNLDILGFRFGELAYITDASFIPEKSFKLLDSIKYLIINALRPKPHSTHFSIDEAVEVAKKIKANETYFIHMSHQVSHEELEKQLPCNIFPAYDGLNISFNF